MTQPPLRGRGTGIVHTARPIIASPSGLPSQALIDASSGSLGLYVGQQWLQPGERVRRHTHPVEEALIFLTGRGEAMLGNERFEIGEGINLHIPADLEHGFTNTGDEPLTVLIVFPLSTFAPTHFVEPDVST
ncbi:MAG: cupin domain-containing protein [Chloroflexota bacterium]|nr:cupin domain-containing protein [Chloroflexota bacterium]